MLKRFCTTIIAAIALVAVGNVPAANATPETAVAPTVQAAPENWDWGNEWGKLLPKAPAAAESHQTNWKMGRLPAHSTLCVANGIGTSYPYEYVLERLNNPTYGPSVTVRNTCTGYSIENRATIESYVDSTAVCAKFTNTGRAWDVAQQKYIWNQNVVIWYNLSDFCVGEDTVRAHRTGMFFLYILGLQYESAYNCVCVIGSTSWSINNVKYFTNLDTTWMGNVYGGRV